MTDVSTTTYRNLVVTVADRIAQVTMNRPEKRNALSIEHMHELIECFDALGRNRDIAVVILRARP